MMRTSRLIAAGGAAVLVALAGCSTKKEEAKPVEGTPVSAIPGHDTLQDTAPKEGPRLMPSEVYLRTYLHFFGDVTPAELEVIARGQDDGSVFDSWADYLGALGFPDYKFDVQRQRYTNTLIMASFERLGIALCVRRAEVEISIDPPPPPIAERRVFAFDLTAKEPTDKEFAERFDVLHRTFLGYPAELAETDRTARFRKLYRDVVIRHNNPSAPASRFTPGQAGWAAVCYGLVRHPEFHLY
jgi:hypothetical protein